MKQKNHKDRKGIVYSTDPAYDYQFDNEEVIETLAPNKQDLRIRVENRKAGKTVTLIQEFIGTKEDLDKLAKEIKVFCGVGGNSKDGEIIIQGEFKTKIYDFLIQKGYKCKKV